MIRETVASVRRTFADLLAKHEFTVMANGTKTLEIAPCWFEANRDTLFGDVNAKYAKAELEWYESMSLNVNDIPGGPPEIWKRVATPDGKINSNYGWCVYSHENGSQYANVLKELMTDPSSRRAVMIYTRPSMHFDQNSGGMQDFMCTNTVQYFVRDGALVTYISMRSNDAVFGYKNDYHWQRHVAWKLAMDLKVPVGRMWWSSGSLHVYERHFYLVDHYQKSMEPSISREDYDKRYPTSPYRTP